MTCLLDIEAQLGRHPVYCLWGLQIKDSEMGHLKGTLCPEATLLGLCLCPFITRNREGGDGKWDPVPQQSRPDSIVPSQIPGWPAIAYKHVWAVCLGTGQLINPLGSTSSSVKQGTWACWPLMSLFQLCYVLALRWFGCLSVMVKSFSPPGIRRSSLDHRHRCIQDSFWYVF